MEVAACTQRTADSGSGMNNLPLRVQQMPGERTPGERAAEPPLRMRCALGGIIEAMPPGVINNVPAGQLARVILPELIFVNHDDQHVR